MRECPDPAPGVTLQQYPGCPSCPKPAPGDICPVTRVNTLPNPALGVTCPESRVTLSQKLYLGSHVHSLQGDPLPRPCTWGNMSTVSRVIQLPMYLASDVTVSRVSHLPDPAPLGSYVHDLQGDSGPRSHVYSLKCDPTSYALYVESLWVKRPHYPC